MATNTITTEQVREAIEQLAAMVAAASISPQTVASILEMLRKLNDQEQKKLVAIAEEKINEIEELGVVEVKDSTSYKKVEIDNKNKIFKSIDANDVEHNHLNQRFHGNVTIDGNIINAALSLLLQSKAEKSVVDNEIADLQQRSPEITENSTYVKLEVDDKYKILSGISSDGIMHFFIPVRLDGGAKIGNKDIATKDEIPTSYTSEQDRDDYIEILLDATNKVVEAREFSGRKIIYTPISLANVIDQYVENNDNIYHEVLIDARRRIIRATDKDGNTIIGGNLDVKGHIRINGLDIADSVVNINTTTGILTYDNNKYKLIKVIE